MKVFTWIKDRMTEPSSYAAAGAAIIGIGAIFNSHIIILIGIAGGELGFLLKEKGII